MKKIVSFLQFNTKKQVEQIDEEKNELQSTDNNNYYDLDDESSDSNNDDSSDESVREDESDPDYERLKEVRKKVDELIELQEAKVNYIKQISQVLEKLSQWRKAPLPQTKSEQEVYVGIGSGFVNQINAKSIALENISRKIAKRQKTMDKEVKVFEAEIRQSIVEEQNRIEASKKERDAFSTLMSNDSRFGKLYEELFQERAKNIQSLHDKLAKLIFLHAQRFIDYESILSYRPEKSQPFDEKNVAKSIKSFATKKSLRWIDKSNENSQLEVGNETTQSLLLKECEIECEWVFKYDENGNRLGRGMHRSQFYADENATNNENIQGLASVAASTRIFKPSQAERADDVCYSDESSSPVLQN